MGGRSAGVWPGRRQQLMRRWAALAASIVLAAAGHAPSVIHVGASNPHARLYGPADMLCDLNKCRLFNLPKEEGMDPNTIVEFGIPDVSGQDRVDMRRCSEQLCRASVLGYPSKRTSPPGHSGPTLFISPIDLQLD